MAEASPEAMAEPEAIGAAEALAEPEAIEAAEALAEPEAAGADMWLAAKAEVANSEATRTAISFFMVISFKRFRELQCSG